MLKTDNQSVSSKSSTESTVLIEVYIVHLLLSPSVWGIGTSAVQECQLHTGGSGNNPPSTIFHAHTVRLHTHCAQALLRGYILWVF